MQVTQKQFEAICQAISDLTDGEINLEQYYTLEDFNNETGIKSSEDPQELAWKTQVLLGDIIWQVADNKFIYYADAWDYLRENDVDLNDTLQLLQDIGGITERTNVCTLATVLFEDDMRNLTGEPLENEIIEIMGEE